MNYIGQIKGFWRAHEEHSFSTTDIALYFHLLDICNNSYWKNPFKRRNDMIQAQLSISFNTLVNARNKLKQAKLIDFKTTNGSANVSYTLSKFDKVTNEVGSEVTNEVSDEVANEVGDEYNININKSENINSIITPLPSKTENSDSGLQTKKQKEKSSAKKEKALQFPFASPKFHEIWLGLVATPKWRKKTEHSLQMALNQLSRYDEEFAIKLMENSISGGYQGVVFNNTDAEYEKWKNNKGGKNNGRYTGSDFD